MVTVPTPISEGNRPDFAPLLSACAAIGPHLRAGAVVVFELTVYPGATEEVCGPALEEASGLVCGRDFHLGYSPERIDPGSESHRLETIVKVVSGQTPEVLERVSAAYRAIITAGVHEAPSIRAAEAAKVIENTQRDLNIALMNELSLIFDRLGIRRATCWRRPARNGISCHSRRALSAATASASTPITSRPKRRPSATTRR